MISIIIPAFNEEKYIRDAVRQFYGLSIPHEIIVSDGGSTDNTVELARQEKVIVVMHPADKRQTIASNRNNGARHAQGEFLAFFDADARIQDPNAFFAQALRHFEHEPMLAAVTPRLRVYPETETLLDRLVFGEIGVNFYLLNNVFKVGAAFGKCQIIRKEAFQKISGYREDLPASEDMDLFHRLAKKLRTKYDGRLIAYHSARRARAWGWPRLIYVWNRDGLSYYFRNKVVSKDWKPVR
jgi:glycosyltransferase involved in cell wall biosynthesis